MWCSGARLCRGGQWGPSETFNKHDVLCREIRSCLKLWYLGCISHIFLLPRITCLSRMDFRGGLDLHLWLVLESGLLLEQRPMMYSSSTQCNYVVMAKISFILPLLVSRICVIHDYYLLHWGRDLERPASQAVNFVKWTNEWSRFKASYVFSTSRSLEA